VVNALLSLKGSLTVIIEHTDVLAEADGFFGSILAVEGITDACTILNAPTGCKMHIGELSKDQFRREVGQSDTRWAEEFYFNQDRLPCTYLDDYDYVFGPAEKLEYVFGRVAEKGYSFIAVLNSPGASLIGDDLQRYIDWAQLKVPTLVLDKPHFTEPFEAGWIEAACSCIDALEPKPMPGVERTVNLVGLSIWQKHWKGNRTELEHLLALCGIKTHCALLADCTVEQIRQLRSAACNVVVHDELGGPLAEHLADRYDMPLVRSGEGAPIGFDATESWIRSVCDAVGADASPAVREIEEHRKKTAETLYRFTLKTGMPRGVRFGVALDASLAWPLTKWLSGYLAMTPVAVQVPNEEHSMAKQLKDYLASIGVPNAWNAEMCPTSPPDVVFSNDATFLRMLRHNRKTVGINLAMPSKDVMHFIPRCNLGPTGTLWILEQLCNGLWRHT
jgi:nitrogenase molybdenum-iron protein alpha/beta subunit